ncbi:glycosyltransferase family 4 protein [Methanonatronarchaeum sp. AMET-Sl]|uniref:glycosyltransferase family 4 protein n=1 Tax=Methanonatronarchaeum sp. AMET-Sl TaxID=3037654 RepID=UPI00244D9BE4|nr:glycosyltransferase family 4 protein [Methanonatronarchaeum sp. AMET-Sl]WGI17590.1 glycosyltransferase family 4 protein [Methanonatronarchaeum sp. AMET-Sl]
MKIAYITDVMYPWVIGGAQKRIWEIARRLTKNHDIHIYTMKWWDGPKTITKNEVTLHGICKPKPLYTNNRRSIKEAIHYTLHTIKIKNNYDIIDVNQFPYLPALPIYLKTRGKKTQMIITWLEVWGEYWNEYLKYGSQIGKIIERTTAHTTDHHISISKTTQNKLKKLGHKSTVIPPGIDIKEIEQIKPSQKQYDALYIGRLIKHKNIDKLIKAVDNTDIKLGIIGTGPQKQKLQKQAQKTNAQIKFHENLEYNQLIGLLKTAKTHVLPSSREGFGITVIEAMACGTPTITVNQPNNAAKHLITPKTGTKTNLNPESLRKTIQNVLANRKINEEKIKQQAKKYDWKRITKKTEKTYKKIQDK